MSEVKKQFDLDAEVGRFIREREVAYAPPISRTLIAAIRREMAKGVVAGERVGDMVNRVRKILSDQGPFRALKIVRTEVVGAFNRGTLENYKQNDAVKMKEWLTARDGNVRPTQAGDFDHQSSDTQRRPIADPFAVSGELLMHPGDPAGSPGNIINCRCTMTPVTAARAAAPPPQEGPAETFTPVRPPPGALLAPRRPRPRRPRPKPARPRRPTATTRPRALAPAARTAAAPRALTSTQINDQFLNKAENIFGQPDVQAQKMMRTALRNPAFRSRVMMNEIVRGTQGINAAKLDDAMGWFSARSSQVELSNALPKFGSKKVARVMAHEMFHGVTHDRGWFARQGLYKINTRNPEANRLLQLYKRAVDRTEEALRAQAANPRFTKKFQNESKGWLKRLQKRKRRSGFGRDYDRGVQFWDELDKDSIVDLEQAGIANAYSLHSPHEYATTSFDQFVFEPAKLRRRDPEMFNFFQNFYNTGVFKRLVEILRSS